MKDVQSWANSKSKHSRSMLVEFDEDLLYITIYKQTHRGLYFEQTQVFVDWDLYAIGWRRLVADTIRLLRRRMREYIHFTQQGSL